MPHPHPRRPTATGRMVLATLALALVATACTGGDGSDDASAISSPDDATSAAAAMDGDPSSESDGDGPVDSGDPVVQLVTHDSFNIGEEVLAAFTEQTGYEVQVLASGDAGVMVNQAVLTAGNPQGDVLFGIDNTLLTRALDADVFVAHEPADAAALDQSLVLDDQWRVTPIDRGDVCLNVDLVAYDGLGQEPPATLDDLVDPAYEGQLVVENPATSSPGLAFALATYATYGADGWEAWWEDLVANDVAVSAGWEDAYYGVFSGSAGSEGDRPAVVSYASSPPAEVIFAEPAVDEAPTAVVTASCFQQVEFAGVLAGTDNEAGARALVDFMVSDTFQADIPLQMFVFPARTDVELPPEFVDYAAVPDDPITLTPAEIAEIREDVVARWTEIVLG